MQETETKDSTTKNWTNKDIKTELTNSIQRETKSTRIKQIEQQQKTL